MLSLVALVGVLHLRRWYLLGGVVEDERGVGRSVVEDRRGNGWLHSKGSCFLASPRV